MTPPEGWHCIKGDKHWGYDSWWRDTPDKVDHTGPFVVQWDGLYYVCTNAEFASGPHGAGFARIRQSLITGPIDTLEAAITAYHLVK